MGTRLLRHVLIGTIWLAVWLMWNRSQDEIRERLVVDLFNMW